MSLETMQLSLPRNAFSARDAARAGDVWRGFQDAAVEGSTRRGWPPKRYTEEACAFVVREQTVRHLRELCFGETIDAKTWVERFRRQIFSTRQIRFAVGGEPVAEATQEWVHVSMEGGQMRAARASDSLLSCFQEEPQEPVVTLPELTMPIEAPTHTFSFDAWFTWMDPLDHANHPAYVDWCDEALCRILHNAGLRPLDLIPRSERVRFKAGVLGMDTVEITLRLVGRTAAGDAVIDANLTRGGRKSADARLIRTTTTGADALVLALQGDSTWL